MAQCWLEFCLCLIAVPHFAITMDVAGGGGGIDGAVVAAERFEEGEAFRDAGTVEQMVEGVLNFLNFAGACADDVMHPGSINRSLPEEDIIKRSEKTINILHHSLVGVCWWRYWVGGAMSICKLSIIHNQVPCEFVYVV
jgi:hypothetical protein